MLLKPKTFLLLGVIASAALFTLSGAADAKGRTGSHRVGGYTSSGKGSHYYGGHTMLLHEGVQLAQTRCRDGSYSNSNGSGTCSHHGGEG
jgi:hypothetical protein